MQQFLDDNIYEIDFGGLNTTAEVIFELSSLIEKDEVRNKKVCLKLGNVNLNQSQLLSIKSLISGVNSILASIDTKSVETEKVALALGIIVSNISAENTLEVSPSETYKMADEIKEMPVLSEEENNNASQEDNNIQENNEDDYNIVEETEEETPPTTEPQESINNNEINLNSGSEKSSVSSQEASNINLTDNEASQKNAQDDVQDELDVIFGKNPAEASIFNIGNENGYTDESEELTDIIIPEQEYTKEDIELEEFPTKYIKQTMRSGQVINYEGNVVIIGDCHPGCEITAFGDITVWGVLSGIAHAGSAGNQKAKVRALKMNAIQLRIANCYSRRPDSLNSVYIEKTNSFTPEEARIINGEIVVFKMND